nr:pseudaminic acid synthase [Bacteroidales bacterium]
KKGEVFTEENVRSIRPGYGLSPKHYSNVIGKMTTKDIERGTPLKIEMVDG